MTRETQTQFAARIGVNKSRITRLKQAGRLVMSDGGMVEVEGSLARLDATRGDRYDLSDIYAAARAETPASALPAPDTAIAATVPVPAVLDLDEIGRRTRHAQMLEREAVARIRDREDREHARLVMRRGAVVKAATDAIGILLNAAETLPDRVAPLLLNVNDSARVRAILRDEMEQLLQIASDRLNAIAGDAA